MFGFVGSWKLYSVAITDVLMNLDLDDRVEGEEQGPLYFVNCITVRHVSIMERLALMIY